MWVTIWRAEPFRTDYLGVFLRRASPHQSPIPKLFNTVNFDSCGEDRPSPSPSDKAGTARSRSSAVTRASAAKRLGMERVEWSRGGSRSQAGGSAQLRGREASAASARRREAVNTSLSRVRASAGGAGQPAQVLSVVPESGDSPTLSKSASGPVYLVSPKRKKASEKLKNTGSHDIHTTGYVGAPSLLTCSTSHPV